VGLKWGTSADNVNLLGHNIDTVTCAITARQRVGKNISAMNASDNRTPIAR
jgi:hypothetical protein